MKNLRRIFTRYPLLAGGLVLGILSGGCSREAKVQKHIERADRYFADGAYDKARIEYMNAARLQPTNAHVVAQLGTIFFEDGIIVPAAAAIDQALALGATDPRLHARQAAILAARNLLPAARAAIQKALAADPTLEEALLLLADISTDDATIGEFRETLRRLRANHGEHPVYATAEAAVLLRERNADAAITLLQPALQAEASAGAAYFVLGGAHLMRTNLSEAKAALARSAELSPLRSNRQIRYVNLLLQTGATNEARDHLAHLIEEAPDFVPARLKRAQLAFAERDLETSRNEVAAILNRDRINLDARQLEAQIHLADNKPERADEVMEELIGQFPDVAQLRYLAALTSLANKKAAQAMAHIDRAYELNPTLPDVVLLRGRLKLARGEGKEVLESAQALLNAHPDARAAHLLMGDALVATGDLSQALAVYQAYEQRFADDPVGPHQVGVTHIRLNQPDLARPSFKRALVRRPDHLPSIERLMALDLAAGRIADARERLQRYLTTHPKSVEGRLLLASVHVNAGQPESAEQVLEELIVDDPTVERAYLQLVEVFVKSGRQDEAISQLLELLGQKANDVRAHMLLGILYNEKGDYLKAADHYEKLLKVTPEFSPALNNLAYLYSEKLKNLDRAYELARKSRDLSPQDPRVADTLGWILYLRGEYADALVHLLESAQKLSNIGEVQYHVGMAHYAMGHSDLARSALSAATTLDPAATWAQAVRDTLLVLDASGPSSSDPETLRRLEELLKQRPKDVLLLTRIGRAQEAAERHNEALAMYRRANEANPGAAAPLIGQARVLVALGKTGEALAIARKARDLTRNDVEGTLELGRVAASAGDMQWSYSLLQEAASSPRSSSEVQVALARSATIVGRLDSARAALEKVATDPVHGSAAKAQLQMLVWAQSPGLEGVPAEVRSRLSAPQSGDPLAEFVGARLDAAAGRSNEALRRLNAILDAHPSFTPAMRSLAILLAAAGQHGEAEKWARRVREADANDAAMAKVLGQAAIARNDFGYAGSMLQEATRTLSDDGEAFLLLGQARAGTRQVADAMQALNKALTLPLNEAQKAKAHQLLEQLDTP